MNSEIVDSHLKSCRLRRQPLAINVPAQGNLLRGQSEGFENAPRGQQSNSSLQNSCFREEKFLLIWMMDLVEVPEHAESTHDLETMNIPFR